MTSEDLLAVLAAIGHHQRLRAVAELADGRLYVSELARRLEMSRPLLSMHLARLEKAGLVVGHRELSRGGKALRYVELAPFDLHVDIRTIVEAVAQVTQDAQNAQGQNAQGQDAQGQDAQDTEGHVKMKGTPT
ncbi:winged helix-turn-helix domain-containing protein [Streptomyces sp. NPDC041068]|uniref:ArsR/SmtB family transcription factor n=1 Tax=Streptomyces sp. NPDC041068 TaxID=3155130 RepID=UPI0033E1011C